jgi:hypothetical protein
MQACARDRTNFQLNPTLNPQQRVITESKWVNEDNSNLTLIGNKSITSYEISYLDGHLEPTAAA